ncbi:MAG TPA: hypothetical protein VGM91_21815 [Conexibacter sp.]|jgi:hypothetical protein
MAPDPRTDTRPDDEAGIHYVERLADDELRRLERESDRVEHDIQDTRREWEAKVNDPAVPGAEAPWPAEEPAEEPLEDVAGDWRDESKGA